MPSPEMPQQLQLLCNPFVHECMIASAVLNKKEYCYLMKPIVLGLQKITIFLEFDPL